jgi:CheY-like chemotaxis protein
METSKIHKAIAGELTYGVLHSLNNLLQGIVGLSEILGSYPNLPKEAKLDIKAISDLAHEASVQVKHIHEATSLPLEPERVVERPAKVSVAPKSRSEVKILVAEDDPLVLKVIAGMLKALGYSVITATDGAEALEKYLQNKDTISLILADLDMPKKSGLQMAEEILTSVPDMKIIVMTGYIHQELEINPSEFGLAAWLEKPMTATRLEGVIKPLVGI